MLYQRLVLPFFRSDRPGFAFNFYERWGFHQILIGSVDSFPVRRFWITIGRPPWLPRSTTTSFSLTRLLWRCRNFIIHLLRVFTIRFEAYLTVFIDGHQIDPKSWGSNRFRLIFWWTILKNLLVIHVGSDHFAWIHATVNLCLCLKLLPRFITTNLHFLNLFLNLVL